MTLRTKSEPNIFNNYQELINKVISFRYYYFAAVFCFLVIAFLHNSYSARSYEAVSKIRPIRGEVSSIVSNDLFRGLQAFQNINEIEDEINNLLSFSTILSTINQLNFEVAYYKESGRFLKKTEELFNNSPFRVTFDKAHAQPINTMFFIEQLSDSTFRVTASQEEAYLYNYVERSFTGVANNFSVDTVLQFNEPFRSSYLNFSISLNNGDSFEPRGGNTKYYFVFYNDEVLAWSYLGNLNVSRMTQPSSILQVRFRGHNRQKTIHFLNNFLVIYFERNLANKNSIATNTINFIDTQLSEVSDSLYVSGSMLRDFRSQNQVMDLGFQGQMIFNQLQKVDEELVTLRRHERYYNFLLDFLRNNENDFSGIILPAAMNVTDQLITQQIGALIELSSERANIISTKGLNNPFLSEVDSKIMVQKQVITETVRNNLNTMSTTINELSYRAQRHSGQISNLPRTELNMVSMQRRFDLNDELYTFLLQRRSEAAIALASNQPDYEILEPARDITSGMVAPRTMLNFIIAAMLGFFFPTLGLIGSVILNNKIQSTNYIEQITNRAVFGIIFNHPRKDEKVVENYNLHPTSESFRALKTSLLLKNQSKGPKVVLVTSPQPEDGKSFIAYNLAVSMAFAGKKTVLIDGDLRKPRLHKKLNIENQLGISSIINNPIPINKITFQTTVENLSFIPAGPVLLSPSKIIESGVFDALIQFVKEDYAYIIIDSAPVGMIADTMFFLKNASNVLLVTRLNSTNKEIFINVIDKFESNRVSNYEVLLNGVNFKGSPYRVYNKYYHSSKT